MSEHILLKENPQIEFRLLDEGFHLTDKQTERNSGFYAYSDLQSIELQNPWFPRFASILRGITWIFNGVPYFPDAATYKKASVTFNFNKRKVGIWLTDSFMASQARKLEKIIDDKRRYRLKMNKELT